MDERLSWSGCLTYSGWFTHISGQSSATARAQDGECLLVEDWRSTTVPCHHYIHNNHWLLTTGWSAWLSGRTSVSGQRSFAVLHSTCSWWVTTYVGKPSAIGQPTRSTHPLGVDKWVVDCNRCLLPHSVEAPSGERLRGKGWHSVPCRLKAVWSMPERFKVVCIPCKALYKCSAFFCFFLLHRTSDIIISASVRTHQHLSSNELFCSIHFNKHRHEKCR